MNLNAIDEYHAHETPRSDGRYGISNDMTGRSRYDGPGYPTLAPRAETRSSP